MPWYEFQPCKEKEECKIKVSVLILENFTSRARKIISLIFYCKLSFKMDIRYISPCKFSFSNSPFEILKIPKSLLQSVYVA